MSLIIGYGNSLRTDDGIGAILAEALGGASFEYLCPELAEAISQANSLAFIDACFGEDIGQIHTGKIEAESSSEMSHQSSPSALLQMAKDLYGSAPSALLITITGSNFDYGDKLSPELQALLPRLLEQVKDIIRIHDKVNDL
jgi:hydrogenase maturation protease